MRLLGRLGRRRRTDVAETVGLGLVALGAGLMYRPAGVIVAGIALVLLSVAHEIGGRR